MKLLLKPLVLVLLIGGLALGWRLWQQRRPDAQSSAVTSPASNTPNSPASAALVALELRADDLLSAQNAPLVRSVTISGSVRTLTSAVVKAKVAGELLSLTPREGDTVKAGQVIGSIDPTEFTLRVQQAQQQADAAQAQVDVARRQLDNNKALVAQEFISATALDTSVSNHNAALANLRAAQRGVDLARKALGDATLKAPLSGTVSQRLAQPGERVAIEGRVLEIMDLTRLELEAAVPAADVGALQPGATATLEVEGLLTPVSAKVARINPSTQTSTRAVLVYLSLAPTPGLRAGLFARGTVALEQRNVLTLPLSSVRVDEAKPYVIVWDADSQTLRRRPITTGQRGLVERTESVEVVQGLQAGERILRGSLGSVSDRTPARLLTNTP